MYIVRHLATQNKIMSESESLQLVIPPHLAGQRLDQALAELVPDYSRSRLQQWIKNGRVLVNGEKIRPRDKLRGNEKVSIEVEHEPQTSWQAEDVPIDIVYEDEAIIIINKPAGLVVHPGTGNQSGTLVNGLLHHDPKLIEVPRSGIVHRIDKDTTGLLVVARTMAAHTQLVERLQVHDVKREYEAIAIGAMTAGGTIDEPMGRHPSQRTRMAVVVNGGKSAVTHYRVMQRFRAHTHIQVNLETGRTHQIRVHMAHVRHPLVGDPVYGGRLRLPPKSSDDLIASLRAFSRQALHAARLGFVHPLTKQEVEWSAPLPEDMQALLKVLKQETREHEDEFDDYS